MVESLSMFDAASTCSEAFLANTCDSIDRNQYILQTRSSRSIFSIPSIVLSDTSNRLAHDCDLDRLPAMLWLAIACLSNTILVPGRTIIAFSIRSRAVYSSFWIVVYALTLASSWIKRIYKLIPFIDFAMPFLLHTLGISFARSYTSRFNCCSVENEGLSYIAGTTWMSKTGKLVDH